jgi:hypothetical protein
MHQDSASSTAAVWLESALRDAMGFSEVEEIAKFILSLTSQQDIYESLVQMLGDDRSELAKEMACQLVEKALVDHDTVAIANTRNTMGPVINCLQCGKIETDGREFCSFCKSVLQYHEDPAAASACAHRDRLIALDASMSQRTVCSQ